MSGLLLFIVTIMYAFVAADQMFFKDNVALAIVYVGYTLANLGLIMVVD